MSYVTADTSIFYTCHKGVTMQCWKQSLRTRSLYLAILYQFLRETAGDTKDIAEDDREGMKTFPVRLGKKNTLLLMASLGFLVDALATKGVFVDLLGVHVDLVLLCWALLRMSATMGFYANILQYPKGDYWAWGSVSLLGLVPVLWAQSSL